MGKVFDHEYKGFKFKIEERVSRYDTSDVLGWNIRGELFNSEGVKTVVDKYISKKHDINFGSLDPLLYSRKLDYSTYISIVVNWYLRRERRAKAFSFKNLLAEIEECGKGLTTPLYLQGSLAEFLARCKKNWIVVLIASAILGSLSYSILFNAYTSFTETIKEKAYKSGRFGAFLDVCEMNIYTEDQRVKMWNSENRLSKEVRSCINQMERISEDSGKRVFERYVFEEHIK